MKLISVFLVLFGIQFIACQPPSAPKEEPENQQKGIEKSNQSTNPEGQSELSKSEVEEYQLYASKITRDAQKTLGQQLMQKVGESGTEGAVEFCNIQAIPLTDSLADFNRVSLKRLTNRPRNPDNMAEGKDLEVLKAYLKHLDSGEKAGIVHQIESEKIDFYFPILTNSFCLKCHGKPKVDVNQATLAVLAEKYPNDSALNYKENQLRGMWKISFPR